MEKPAAARSMPVCSSRRRVRNRLTRSQSHEPPATVCAASWLGLIGVSEHVSFAVGAVLFAVLFFGGVGPVVGGAVLWEAADRGFQGGLFGSGRELQGLLLGTVAPRCSAALAPLNRRVVQEPADAFIMSCVYLQAVAVPALFAAAFVATTTRANRATGGSGFSLGLCYLYHVLRIGPYFMNFAYYYTLCHKEGHTRRGFYKEPFNSFLPLRHVFNWWISLFFGVMPGAFAFGHSLNHHRYNNGALDVVSTADKPRDSFVNFLAYLPRWTLYSLNVSSVLQFAREGNAKVALQMLAGCVYWWAWFALWCKLGGLAFATAYVLYPLAENILLLAAINWSWHAFASPLAEGCEYVGSTTIVGGPINVLYEDLHVEHHGAPTAHWTTQPRRALEHWDAYVAKRATVLYQTHAFEVFVLVVLGRHDVLAAKLLEGHTDLAKAKAILQAEADKFDEAGEVGTRAAGGAQKQGKGQLGGKGGFEADRGAVRWDGTRAGEALVLPLDSTLPPGFVVVNPSKEQGGCPQEAAAAAFGLAGPLPCSPPPPHAALPSLKRCEQQAHGLSLKEKEALIKARLRTCSWGPRALKHHAASTTTTTTTSSSSSSLNAKVEEATLDKGGGPSGDSSGGKAKAE